MLIMAGFDTHEAYEELVRGDCFSSEQAERILSVVKDSISGEVATKADIADLRTELKTDIADLRVEMARQHTRLILWGTGLMGAAVALLKALDFLLGT